MKRINIILTGLILLISFNACQKDEIVTINPAAEKDGGLTFKLNQARYSNYTYVLNESNDGSDMDALTCAQPDYGFTAAVNYFVQVSFNQDMSNLVELSTAIKGEKVGVNTKEMNKAIQLLYKGDMPNPSVAKDVWVRLKGIISQATPTPLVTTPTVKPAYSNVVKLNVMPYYVPNLVNYYEAKKLKPYFIIGLGDGKWTNDKAGIGVSIIPLSVTTGKVYNAEGQGIWKFTGYFEASKSFKLIRDLGSWGEQWGNKGSEGINQPISKAIAGEEPSNFKVPADGYYTITLNSITNVLTIEKSADTPTLYSNMGLVGQMTNWGDKTPDIAMKPFQTANNHVWYTTYTFASDSQCKFRAESDWGKNWGTPSADDADPTYSFVAIGKAGGKNLIQKAGTYTVVFNDQDGCYYFFQ